MKYLLTLSLVFISLSCFSQENLNKAIVYGDSAIEWGDKALKIGMKKESLYPLRKALKYQNMSLFYIELSIYRKEKPDEEYILQQMVTARRRHMKKLGEVINERVRIFKYEQTTSVSELVN